MNDILPVPHGRARLRQRGFRAGDPELIRSIGIEVGVGEYFVPATVVYAEICLLQRKINSIRRRRSPTVPTSKHDEISMLKKAIHQLERISNRKIVLHGNRLITAYPMAKEQSRRALRRMPCRERAMLRRTRLIDRRFVDWRRKP